MLSPDVKGTRSGFEPQTSEKRIELLTTTLNEVGANTTFNRFRNIYTFAKTKITAKDVALMTGVYYQSVEAGGFHNTSSEGLVVGIKDGFFKRKHRLFVPETPMNEASLHILDLSFLPLGRATVKLPDRHKTQVGLAIDTKHSKGRLKSFEGSFEMPEHGQGGVKLTSVLDVGLIDSTIDWQESLSSALEQVKNVQIPMSKDTYDLYMRAGQVFLDGLEKYESWLNSEAGEKTAKAMNQVLALVPAAPQEAVYASGVANG